jgi:hypothetical protein
MKNLTYDGALMISAQQNLYIRLEATLRMQPQPYRLYVKSPSGGGLDTPIVFGSQSKEDTAHV